MFFCCSEYDHDHLSLSAPIAASAGPDCGLPGLQEKETSWEVWRPCPFSKCVRTELQYITITDELRKYFNLLTYDILMFVLQLFQTITPLMVRKSRIISVLSRMTQRRRWIKDSVWRQLCVKRIMIMSEKENERAANFLFSVGVEVKPDLFKNRINTTAR